MVDWDKISVIANSLNQNYDELFKSNDVAIIGNSKNILFRKQSKLIDNHLEIIRVNGSTLSNFKEFVGHCTDVLCSNEGYSALHFRNKMFSNIGLDRAKNIQILLSDHGHPKILFSRNPENLTFISDFDLINNINMFYYSNGKINGEYLQIINDRKYNYIIKPKDKSICFRGGITVMLFLIKLGKLPNIYGFDYIQDNPVYFDVNEKVQQNASHDPNYEMFFLNFLSRTKQINLHKAHYLIDYSLTVSDKISSYNDKLALYKCISDAGYDYFEIGYRNNISDTEILQIKKDLSKISESYPCFISIKVNSEIFKIDDFNKQKETEIDLIRFEFHNNNLTKNIDNCAELLKLGYKVSINIIDIDKFSFNEIDLLIENFIKLKLTILSFENIDYNTFEKVSKYIKEKINSIDSSYYYEFGFNYGYNCENSFEILKNCFDSEDEIAFVGTTIDLCNISYNDINDEKLFINFLKNNNINI